MNTGGSLRTFAPHRPYGYRRCNINVVGDGYSISRNEMRPPENNRLALSPWIPPMQYNRCRAGACSCRKQAFCTFSTATAFLQTHLSTLRLLFRFFAKKTEPKNASTVFRYAETGECLRTPSGRSPYFRCAEVVGAFALPPMSIRPRGSLRLFAAPSV